MRLRRVVSTLALTLQGCQEVMMVCYRALPVLVLEMIRKVFPQLLFNLLRILGHLIITSDVRSGNRVVVIALALLDGGAEAKLLQFQPLRR